jgi:hypothetical protein
MEFKGTQGKWFLFENVNENGRYLFTVRNENYANYLKDFQIQSSTISEVETLKANMLLISNCPELLENAQMHIDALDLSNIEFYEKYGFNVSELIPRTRELIKQATEL